MSNIVEGRLLRIPELIAERRQFQGAIIGQDAAIDAFATLAAKIKAGYKSQRSGPIDIKFLAGPSGVGKTEIVYRLAEILGGNREDVLNDPELRGKVIKINGGEFQHGHEVAKLIGSPPGYRGSSDPASGEQGVSAVFSRRNLDSHKISFIDKNGQKKDAVIILIDEAEKADDSLHKIFLSILDKGQIELGDNTVADLSNAVIFYTSNVGNDRVEKMRASQEGQDVEEQARQLTMEAFREAFPPEFRGRIDEVILFEPLKPSELEKITFLKLQEIEQGFWESTNSDIELQISPKAIQWLLEQGYNPSEGARGVNKVVKKFIADRLVLLQADQDLDRKTIYIDIDADGADLEFFDVPVDEERNYRLKEEEITPVVDKPLPVVQEVLEASPRLGSLEDRKGNLTSHGTTISGQEVQELNHNITDPLRTALRISVEEYQLWLKKLVDSGMVSAERVGADPRILEIAKDKVIEAWRMSCRNSISRGYENSVIRDLVRVGIGTSEMWMRVLGDHKKELRDKREEEEELRRQRRGQGGGLLSRLLRRTPKNPESK